MRCTPCRTCCQRGSPRCTLITSWFLNIICWVLLVVTIVLGAIGTQLSSTEVNHDRKSSNYLNEETKSSPAYAATLALLVVIYIVNLIVICRSENLYMLKNMKETGDFASFIKDLVDCTPQIVMRATSSHTEKTIYSYTSNGKPYVGSYNRKVVTDETSDIIPHCSWRDTSGPLVLYSPEEGKQDSGKIHYIYLHVDVSAYCSKDGTTEYCKEQFRKFKKDNRMDAQLEANVWVSSGVEYVNPVLFHVSNETVDYFTPTALMISALLMYNGIYLCCHSSIWKCKTLTISKEVSALNVLPGGHVNPNYRPPVMPEPVYTVPPGIPLGYPPPGGVSFTIPPQMAPFPQMPTMYPPPPPGMAPTALPMPGGNTAV